MLLFELWRWWACFLSERQGGQNADLKSIWIEYKSTLLWLGWMQGTWPLFSGTVPSWLVGENELTISVGQHLWAQARMWRMLVGKYVSSTQSCRTPIRSSTTIDLEHSGVHARLNCSPSFEQHFLRSKAEDYGGRLSPESIHIRRVVVLALMPKK